MSGGTTRRFSQARRRLAADGVDFGDKQALFETVLTDELDKLAASVAPVPSGFEEIGEFAGRTFDYQAAHPQLVRLLLWEGLSGGVADEANRTAHYKKKAQAYAAAQREGVLDGELLPSTWCS